MPHLAFWPTFTILPSLTAITGESCLAKIETAWLVSEVIGTAALPDLTCFLASASTLLSAYFDGAATGK